MADKYSTIQQHQPLRIPNGWSGQEKQLIVQLDEVFDDIYKRFGRLKLSDLSEGLRKTLSDTEGAIATLEFDISGLTVEVGNKIAKTESIQTVDEIINAAESYTDGLLEYYSTSTQTAEEISAAVSNCYGKISHITINTTGIKIDTNKILDIESGCELRIRSGADIAIYSGGKINVASGGELSIQSGGTFTVLTPNFSVSTTNEVTFKGGGEIQSGRSLSNNGTINLNASSIMNLNSGADFYINSGGNVTIRSGGKLMVNSGGNIELYSGGMIDLKAGSSLVLSASGIANITIADSGIDLIGNRYVRLTSGNSVVQIDPTQINMNTSGLVSILGHGNSIIKLEGSSQTIFQADSSGVVQAVSINSSEINATTLNVTNLNVTGRVNAELEIPTIVVSDTAPTGHGIVWLEPNSSVITPFSETRSVADASGDLNHWTETGHNTYTWNQTCSLSSSISAGGATKAKISGRLYKNGNTAADATELYAKLVLSDNTKVDLGKVGTFPTQQSLRWNYGFSKELTITAIGTGLSITSVEYTYKVTNSTNDYMAYYSYPNSVTLQVSGETGTAGQTDECTVHYIA